MNNERLKPRLSFRIADWISNAFWNLIFKFIDLIFKILSIIFYPFSLILNWWDDYKVYKYQIYEQQVKDFEKTMIDFGNASVEFCKTIDEWKIKSKDEGDEHEMERE